MTDIELLYSEIAILIRDSLIQDGNCPIVAVRTAVSVINISGDVQECRYLCRGIASGGFIVIPANLERCRTARYVDAVAGCGEMVRPYERSRAAVGNVSYLNSEVPDIVPWVTGLGLQKTVVRANNITALETGRGDRARRRPLDHHAGSEKVG